MMTNITDIPNPSSNDTTVFPTVIISTVSLSILRIPLTPDNLWGYPPFDIYYIITYINN